MQSLYQTQNTMLATVLASAGVQFAEENGHRIPALCQYHAQNLARLGYKGHLLWDAAQDAWKRKKAGTIVYQFERCELLDTIITAFDKMKLTMAKQAAQENGPNTPGETFEKLTPVDIGKIGGMLAANRDWMMNSWTLTPPILCIYGEAMTEGNTQTNSCKIISLNASEETRRKVGV